MAMRVLRVAAALEALTLTMLLVNLATVHAEPVTRLGGPLHGASYVAVIAATALVGASGPGAAAAKWLAWVPGVGGMLALHRLRPVRPAS